MICWFIAHHFTTGSTSPQAGLSFQAYMLTTNLYVLSKRSTRCAGASDVYSFLRYLEFWFGAILEKTSLPPPHRIVRTT
jgi:hypothetical protein